MAKLYKGNIRKRTGRIFPENNIFSTANTFLYKQDAYLLEIKENKFIDVEELSLTNAKILNVYSFNIGELYVDIQSLIDIRDVDKKQTKQKTK